jgi:hypothetical protein
MLLACTPPTEEVGDAPDTETDTTATATATASTGASSGDETAADTGVASCEGDAPVGGGAWQCPDNERTHQRDPAQCDAIDWPACTDPGGGCATDDDCSPGRVCAQLSDEQAGDMPLCGCLERPCTIADDCPDDFTCFCGSGSRGSCEPANCETDADCGGELCATSVDACGVGGLYCTSPADECDGGTYGCVWEVEVGHFVEGGAIGCP